MDVGGPLLTVESSNLWSNRKVRLAVFEDRVELTTRNLIGNTTESVRYEQMAGLRVDDDVFYADLVIETRGGGRLLARGLRKKQAREAEELIRRCSSGERSWPDVVST